MDEFIINVHKIDDFIKSIKWTTSSQENKKLFKSIKWASLSLGPRRGRVCY